MYLPRVKLKMSNKSNKPNWRKEVQLYKTDSIWWHNIWKQYGQPKQGVVYDSKLKLTVNTSTQPKGIRKK